MSQVKVAVQANFNVNCHFSSYGPEVEILTAIEVRYAHARAAFGELYPPGKSQKKKRSNRNRRPRRLTSTKQDFTAFPLGDYFVYTPPH
jgi:hypothetical protein